MPENRPRISGLGCNVCMHVFFAGLPFLIYLLYLRLLVCGIFRGMTTGLWRDLVRGGEGGYSFHARPSSVGPWTLAALPWRGGARRVLNDQAVFACTKREARREVFGEWHEG